MLLDRYGANALGVAMKEALSKNMPHPNAVRKSLEMQRLERHEPRPSALIYQMINAFATWS